MALQSAEDKYKEEGTKVLVVPLNCEKHLPIEDQPPGDGDDLTHLPVLPAMTSKADSIPTKKDNGFEENEQQETGYEENQV